MKIPHNKQIEKLVLGTIIGEAWASWTRWEILTRLFPLPTGKIYEACCRVSDRGNRPDLMTVYQELGGGVEMLTLTDILGNSTFDVYQHAAILVRPCTQEGVDKYTLKGHGGGRLQTDNGRS